MLLGPPPSKLAVALPEYPLLALSPLSWVGVRASARLPAADPWTTTQVQQAGRGLRGGKCLPEAETPAGLGH